MILLGDQPLISSKVINHLIKAKYQSHQRIVVPFYAGKRGNPVLFEKSMFPELLVTTGDEGGRSVIQQHPHDVAMVEMEYPGMHMDIDTWEDYQVVLSIWKDHLRVRIMEDKDDIDWYTSTS